MTTAIRIGVANGSRMARVVRRLRARRRRVRVARAASRPGVAVSTDDDAPAGVVRAEMATIGISFPVSSGEALAGDLQVDVVEARPTGGEFGGGDTEHV